MGKELQVKVALHYPLETDHYILIMVGITGLDPSHIERKVLGVVLIFTSLLDIFKKKISLKSMLICGFSGR